MRATPFLVSFPIRIVGVTVPPARSIIRRRALRLLQDAEHPLYVFTLTGDHPYTHGGSNERIESALALKS